jgi:hypothetical protein
MASGFTSFQQVELALLNRSPEVIHESAGYKFE